jgi:hypothetical protein
MNDAVRFANAAGALAVTRLGAQPSAPHRDEIERLLREQPVEEFDGSAAQHRHALHMHTRPREKAGMPRVRN